jgi:4-carboxymuconolactone decarboxylase
MCCRSAKQFHGRIPVVFRGDLFRFLLPLEELHSGKKMENQKETLLLEIKRKRGFVLDFHRLLAEEDPEFLRCYEAMISASYAKEGALGRKIREFVFIAALTAVQADKNHIKVHITRAVETGATKAEILEILECIYPPCGTLKFMNGLEAFKEVFSGQGSGQSISKPGDKSPLECSLSKSSR